MGPHHHRNKDGSNSNYSTTSPSRIEDAEFVNSLLTSTDEDSGEEGLFLSLILKYVSWPGLGRELDESIQVFL